MIFLLACVDEPDGGADAGIDTAADSGTAETDSPGDTEETADTSLPTDVDGDGHDATAWGGDDCDDADPSIHPGAPEQCDPVDHDCDGDTLDAGVCAGEQDVDAVLSLAASGPAEVPGAFAAMAADLVGDLTGDGLDDWMVGCNFCLDGGTRSGYALYAGGATWRRAVADEVRWWTFYEDGTLMRTGDFLADGGDFDGDGVQEAWFGADWRSYVHEGPYAEGSEGVQEGADAWCHVGTSEPGSLLWPAVAADVDGDGDTELVLSSWGASDTDTEAGVYLFGISGGEEYGEGCPGVRVLGVDGYEAVHGTTTGISPGDLDGDGAADLVIDGGDRGVYVLSGLDAVAADGVGMDEIAYQHWTEEEEDQRFDVHPCRATPGDVDNDGVQDWMLCSPASYTVSLDYEVGEVFLVRGGQESGEFDADAAAGSLVFPEHAGTFIDTAASDLDGDGARELAVRTNGPLWIVRGMTSFPGLRFTDWQGLALTSAEQTWYPMDGGRDVTGDGMEDLILVQWTGDAPTWAWGIYAGWAIPWDEPEWW